MSLGLWHRKLHGWVSDHGRRAAIKNPVVSMTASVEQRQTWMSMRPDSEGLQWDYSWQTANSCYFKISKCFGEHGLQ